jgi:thiol-disulfide isomerase/thioredoxin
MLPATVPAASDDPIWHPLDDRGEVAVKLYFFWSQTCPHCQRARPFVDQLAAKHAWLQVHSADLVTAREEARRYVSLARQLGQEARSVPAFLFCREMYTGYDNDQGMGVFLEQRLQACHRSLTANAPSVAAPQTPGVSLPWVGVLDPNALSLPLLTLVLAGVDAFNPCAFFVLLFLLSLLVHARSRARMLAVGGIFVGFSGLVYFLFMAAWLNVFLLIGELRGLTMIAGAVALGFAVVNIKDYFWFQRGVSLSIPERAKPGLFARMRQTLNADSLPAMAAAAVMLALAANTYELLCTAGFPMVYTRVLTLHALSPMGYYSYLLLYNVIYVVPMAVIVLVFTFTLGARKLTDREGRILKLVSGLMMLGLGGMLVLAPERLSSVVSALGLLLGALGGTALVLVAERQRARRSHA